MPVTEQVFDPGLSSYFTVRYKMATNERKNNLKTMIRTTYYTYEGSCLAILLTTIQGYRNKNQKLVVC